MSKRLIVLPTALLALAALAQAGPAEELAALLRHSSASGDPVMTFFTGARQMRDQTLDRATIQRALQLANVKVDGPLAQVLGTSNRLIKRGDRLQIDRSRPSVVPLGGAGFARLDKTISLRVRGGDPRRAPQGDREHVGLADSGTGYVKIDGVSGVKVSEDGSDFYKLGDIYAYTRSGRPTIKFWASGFLGIGKWTTHSFDPPKPLPAANAPAGAANTAVVDLKYGLEALPLRTAPGSGLITRLSNGTAVEVLEQSGDFWKVKVDGQVGFAHKDHLRLGGTGIAERIPGQ